ncbi:MAG: hypothetical protein AAB897_00035 [Patescibacteria group bacterium]
MAFRDDQGGQGGGFQKKMHEGNWKCGTCQAPITKLPFEPNPSRLDSLKCIDCWKKSRPQRDNRF